jgi:CheY-like chemotaxis protein
MGGEITVQSREGGGSTFAFTAVLKLPQNEHASDKTQARAPAASRVLKILLAEDEPTNRMVAEDLLTERGHEVAVAQDGLEALKRLESEEFDLVLMDIRMPRMRGDEAVRKIRAGHDGVNKQTPVVAVTAYALKQDQSRFEKAGFDAYLTKPIKVEELEKVLADIGKICGE